MKGIVLSVTTRLYSYDNGAVGIAKNLEPARRSGFQITRVNQAGLEPGDYLLRLVGER